MVYFKNPQELTIINHYQFLIYNLKKEFKCVMCLVFCQVFVKSIGLQSFSFAGRDAQIPNRLQDDASSHVTRLGNLKAQSQHKRKNPGSRSVYVVSV